MVYNAMYPIRQNSYYPKDSRAFVKQKEDEESSKSASSELSQNTDAQETNNQKGGNFVDKDKRDQVKQELKESEQAQTQALNSLNANIKNSTVNIAQIIKDFKNTAIAIATPDDLNEEVNTYLSLVENQVTKDEPNVKLIKSNLRNASSLLDNYISETLQRPSKVVENWIDALFLQNIDYKFNDEEVNKQFLVKFPEKAQQATESQQETTEVLEETKPTVTVPQDDLLKSLFIQAKKFSYANEPQKAMETFQTALNRSTEVEDKDTQAKILYEIGKIYDDNDYLSQALTSYNKSLSTTEDTNVKTKAHFAMAQIYDDVAQFDPAINHYMSSISYAGETENLAAQSTSLTKIGNIYTDQYNKEAFDFFSEANTIAKETDNSKVKGYVASNTGDAYNKFNEPQSALKSYSESIKEYKNAEAPSKVASNYLKAAKLMVDYNNPQKAKSLLNKALEAAVTAKDSDLIAKIKDVKEESNNI